MRLSPLAERRRPGPVTVDEPHSTEPIPTSGPCMSRQPQHEDYYYCYYYYYNHHRYYYHYYHHYYYYHYSHYYYYYYYY
jgi:hypothetical protein